MKKLIAILLIVLSLLTINNNVYASSGKLQVSKNSTTETTLSDEEYEIVKQCFKQFNEYLHIIRTIKDKTISFSILESKGIKTPAQLFKPIK
jgi:hypothetical protein